SPESAFALLGQASRRVEELRRIDDSIGGVRENLQTATAALEEASYALRDYLSRLEANPGRLEELESRLEALARLERKYGHSLEEVLEFLRDVRARIATLENAGEHMEALRKRRARLAQDYEKQAADLTARRRAAGTKLAKQVEREMTSLAMERAVFRI